MDKKRIAMFVNGNLTVYISPMGGVNSALYTCLADKEQYDYDKYVDGDTAVDSGDVDGCVAASGSITFIRKEV